MRERLTLAERMAQAGARKRAERELATAGGPQFGHSLPFAATQPFAHSQPFANSELGAAAEASWQVAGAPGQHLTLMPGQMHFGGQVASLRTLLGSCVAVTLWHPVRRIGGMCHFLLPTRTRRDSEASDGRYGDEAIGAMVQMLRLAGTDPADYRAHLYGGADTMPEGTNLKFNVGERNIELGMTLIDRHGFQLQGVDVGEDVPRTVTLTLATGEVGMRRGMGKAPALQMHPGAAATRRK